MPPAGIFKLKRRLFRRDLNDRFHIGEIIIAEMAFDLMPFCKEAHRWHLFFAKPARHLGFPPAAGLERAA